MESRSVGGVDDMAKIQGHGECVLIIDGDQSVRKMILQMVLFLGYSATAVASGEEAVSHLERNPAQLVMFEMHLNPGLNGCDTYARILALRPGQPAIVVSAYAEMGEVDRALDLGVSQFVQKPFTIHELGSAIQKALAGSDLA